MKKLLILLLFTICLTSYGEEAVTRTITIQGTSEVSVAPDTITINAVAETIDSDLSKAVNLNNKIIRDARSLLLKEGIEEDNIYTASYTVSHKIEKLSSSSVGIRKYFVRNQIIITSNNLNKAGDLIASLEKAGVNNILDLNYSSSKRKMHEKEALILAYKDAKERAEAIASLEGYSIIPMSINSNIYFPRGGNYMIQAQSLEKSDPAPIYNPKTIDITGNVNATFQLKK